MAEENKTENVVPRESVPELLDFSTLKFKTREEFKNALSKVPDLRMRPEKVRDSEACCQHLVVKKKNPAFPFPNPIPTPLQKIRMEELSTVDIDWKMLTLVRPKTKLEEEVYTKIVDMERCKLKTSTLESGVIDNMRKKPHISICVHDEKGTQEVYRYQTYAREKRDNLLEEDKSADYIQQVAEMLSTSKLKGDYTKEIVKKKIKSRKRDERKEAKMREMSLKLKKNESKKLSTLSPSTVEGVAFDNATHPPLGVVPCPNGNDNEDKVVPGERKVRPTQRVATPKRPKNKSKSRTKKGLGIPVVVP